MRTSRRLLAAASVIVALVAPPASGHAGFGDVAAGRFYTEAVQWMVDESITNGTSPTCFSPADVVTRGQAAAFMWRMEGEPSAPAHDFVDVVASWQHGAVSWMRSAGITTGTTPSTYGPDQALTRGQLAALLWRLAGEPSAPAHDFVDVVASWQQGAVSWLAHTGITTGTTPSTFAPDVAVTRGELATFFWRYSGSPAVVVDPASPACGGAGDDEFDTGPVDLLTASAPGWTVRNGAAAERIDIDLSAAGALVIVPRPTHHNGWYATSEGPFVHREVVGDFAAAIRVKVVSADDPTSDTAPANGYNSGGFVLRDGAQPHDWVMYNIGGQTSTSGFAREVKTTVDGTSVLHLQPIASTTYRLLICRVGDEIRYFHGAPDATAWTADTIEHSRADFGETLQIGIVANAWEGSGPHPWVEVERIRFGTPTQLSECTSSVGEV